MNFLRSSVFSHSKLPDELAPSPHPSDSGDVEVLPGESGGAGDLEGGPSNAAHSQHAWSFGSMVKSLARGSGGMLEAYRRDLQEFGSGLKMETQALREVVRDLPSSVEALETVGQAMEELGLSVWRGTSEIISQGKDVVRRINEDEPSASLDVICGGAAGYASSTPIAGGRYSRFEAQVRAMQHESSTYCDEPDDKEDYNTWRASFRLQDKEEAIESLLKEIAFVGELQSRIVPSVMDYDTFWTRYFYRLHKLQQAEAARANLVKWATATEEEDLTWDLDDDMEAEGDDEKHTESSVTQQEGEKTSFVGEQSGNGKKEGNIQAGTLKDQTCIERAEAATYGDQTFGKVPNVSGVDDENSGWEVDEDVDMNGSEEKKSSNSEASWEVPEAARPDVRKRFTAVDEKEDLSWDVDDEDDNAK